VIPLSGRMAPNSRVGQGGKGSGLDLFLLALTMLPASDAQLESKASALACRSKAEALDSSGPGPRLAGTMTKAFLFDLRSALKGIKTSTGWMRGLAVSGLDHHAGHGLVSIALQGDQESAPSAGRPEGRSTPAPLDLIRKPVNQPTARSMVRAAASASAAAQGCRRTVTGRTWPADCRAPGLRGSA